jgi:hypothetical protein
MASTRATRPELASATAPVRLSGTLVAPLGLAHAYLQKRFVSLLYDLGPRRGRIRIRLYVALDVREHARARASALLLFEASAPGSRVASRGLRGRI